jgi:hypothetical protein
MLQYFMAFWSVSRPFRTFCGHWYILCFFGIFFPFWYAVPLKIWQTLLIISVAISFRPAT